MYGAIFGAFFAGITNILLKQSLNLNKGGDIVFIFFSQIQFFLIGLYFLFNNNLELYFSGVNLGIYILILMAIIAGTIYSLLVQHSYANEKISVLQPYSNLDKLIAIIVSFFIFSDTNLNTLYIAILTFLIIIFSSIDYKNFKIGKYVGLYIIGNFFSALRLLIIGFLLYHMTSSNFIFLYSLITIPLLLLYLVIKGQLGNFSLNSKKFYLIRIGASITWGLAYFISIFLIKELGIVISSLLSLVSLIITLLLGYFLLKDIPSKKDVIVSVFVLIMIGIGYYFK